MNFNYKFKTKLREYFQSRLGMYDYRNGWLKGDCPTCGAHDKYGVNISHNRTNCFKCGYHERPIYAVKTFESLPSIHEVRILLNAFEGYDFVEKKVERIESKPVILPDSFQSLDMGKSQYGKSARNYMKGRGFNIKKLSQKGFGYCTAGDYEGYIIMPFFVHGKMVYFHARNFLSSGPKFNNPPIGEFGVGKSTLVYNLDALYLYDEVSIVESVMNAETLGQTGTVLGGKKISTYQYSIYVKSPVETINILLDDDAWSEAIQLAMQLCRHKNVRLIKMPKEQDVNDIGKKATKKLIKATPISTYMDLVKIKNQR